MTEDVFLRNSLIASKLQELSTLCSTLLIHTTTEHDSEPVITISFPKIHFNIILPFLQRNQYRFISTAVLNKPSHHDNKQVIR
jgi:hypothetical protein